MNDSRIDALIASMDLSQKVRLLTGEDHFTLWADPEIGLRKQAFSDGPTGVRGLKFIGGKQAVLFPNATLLASAWDERVTETVGDLLGQEAQRQRINTVLGPTINLHRSVLGGRLFEAYSEDPLLTGLLAASYVRGLQAHRVAACLKHLVANESETDRHFADSRVAEDVLREVYLLPFEIAHTDAGVWSMMAAYNAINGTTATENGVFQQEIVKDEWGFDGLIMSDWLATKTTVAPANNGLDLVMPGPNGPWGDKLVAAVEDGQVAETFIDDKVRRLLLLAQRTGALDEDRDWPSDWPAPDSEQRRREMIELATAGMTVLRNRDQTLPLSRDTSLALIGRHATKTICMGGGSAQVYPPYQVSIAEGLTAAGATMTVTDGVEVRRFPLAAEAGILTHEGRTGMGVQLQDAAGEPLDDYHADRSSISVGTDDDTDQPVARVVLRATVHGDGPMELGVLGTGSWTVRIGDTRHEQVLSIDGLDAGAGLFRPPSWTTRLEVDGSIEITAELVVGLGGAVPSESLTGVEHLDEMMLAGGGRKALIAHPVPKPVDQVLAEARTAAEQADVAVVVVGTTEMDETESMDKHTIALPGEQDALVHAVAAAARRTVVMVNSATPILMPWADQVDAIVVIGLPGQEAGHAVAAALFGDLEPAGRLVTTWPAAEGAAPAWNVTPDDRRGLDYSEGRFLGYRGHAPYGQAPEPAHWLGEGQGYGSWEYADVRVMAAADAQSPRVEVDIRNTAERRSREVVQVYFAPQEEGEPIRLVGWASATVEPGESATVSVPTDARMWRRWNTAEHRWGRLSGAGELLIARGLGDVRARTRVAVAV